ncbi:MAG: glycosyltransferase family 4 protein [Croceibacterium sp.]
MVRSKVAVFHPGVQHSWQTARALQDLGRLEWYATSIYHQPDRWPYSLGRLPGPVGRRLAREFSRFSAPGLDPTLVRTGGIHEWLERMAARAGFFKLSRRIDIAGNHAFARLIEEEIGSAAPFALWGYDGSSRDAFGLAAQRGRFCVLDRTIGHWRTMNTVLDGVREQWPEWFEASSGRIPQHQIDLAEDELHQADLIVTGSEFAARTIREESPFTASKLRVLPYCYDEVLFADQPTPTPVPRDGPVKFLLVGQLGPRKGIHLLLQAISRIPPQQASLTLLGKLSVPPQTFAPYRDRVTHISGVPRSEVPAVMAAHHVLVFPSYFEGSALSLIEGLASGLAIIQSENSGNGVTPDCGIMLEELSVDALTEAMMVPVRDRALLDSWRLAAQAEAPRYSFAQYRDNIEALLTSAGL